jgi:hypothetical protein
MAYRVACDMPFKIKAIASFESNMQQCKNEVITMQTDMLIKDPVHDNIIKAWKFFMLH